MTLRDILAQLTRPGRDPREDLPAPIFKRGVLKLEDLQTGMELMGCVLNVVDFGAFVDIGLHDSGLVHVSQLANRYVQDPHDVVSVGDIVKVWVMEIDKTRRRVSLTMIAPGTPRHEPSTQRGRKGMASAGEGARSGRSGVRQGNGLHNGAAGAATDGSGTNQIAAEAGAGCGRHSSGDECAGWRSRETRYPSAAHGSRKAARAAAGEACGAASSLSAEIEAEAFDSDHQGDAGREGAAADV